MLLYRVRLGINDDLHEELVNITIGTVVKHWFLVKVIVSLMNMFYVEHIVDEILRISLFLTTLSFFDILAFRVSHVPWVVVLHTRDGIFEGIMAWYS